jgi:23S rRNA pseudouridine1911/1915/1917 synthase
MLLLEYLLINYKDTSRSKIKKLLANGAVRVDGVVQTQFNFPVNPNNKVQIIKDKDKAITSKADQNLRHFATIEYEDPWLMIVNKKTGVLSVPTGHHGFCLKTLLDGYLERKGEHRTAHVVHRLDKETSGLMIYAKSREIQDIFTHNWHDIIADRRYFAITNGIPKPADGSLQNWLWDDNYGYVHSSKEDNGGKFAKTHYHTLQTNNNHALLDVRLETGRKNQIRVHLQDIKCPVVGDSKYGNGDNPIGRLGLHAYKLAFTHPITHKQMIFETPLPASFQKLIDQTER